MKKFKLFSILLLVGGFLFGSNLAFAVDDPTDPGIKRRIVGGSQSTPPKEYVLVRFASNDQDGPDVVSGDVLAFDLISDDGISVNLTTTSNDATIAGIAVMPIQTSDRTNSNALDGDQGGRNWGWIQTYGRALAKITAGGTNNHSAGDPFITSADSGAITAYEPVSNTYNGSGMTKIAKTRSGGFFFDAADGTKTREEVFVDL